MRRAVWLGIAALVLVAVAVAYAFCRVYSQLQFGLDFGSVFDALVLAFVAILIEHVYSKHYSDQRTDTELLLKCVDEVKETFDRFVVQSRDCDSGSVLTQAQQTALTYASRDLSNAVHSLEVALKHCNVQLDKLKYGDLKDARYELNEAVTNHPYPGPYDPVSRANIQRCQKAMRDELIRMAFAINRR